MRRWQLRRRSPRFIVEVTNLRVGAKAIEVHGQHTALAGCGWGKYPLKAKVVRTLSQPLALRGVVGP